MPRRRFVRGRPDASSIELVGEVVRLDSLEEGAEVLQFQLRLRPAEAEAGVESRERQVGRPLWRHLAHPIARDMMEVMPPDLEIDRGAPVRRVELDGQCWVDLVDGFVRDAPGALAEVCEHTSWTQGEVLRYDTYVPEKRLSAGLRADSMPLLRQSDLHLCATYRQRFTGVAAILYRHWLHGIPRADTANPRISLTWRWTSRHGRPDTNPGYFDGRQFSDRPRLPGTRTRRR